MADFERRAMIERDEKYGVSIGRFILDNFQSRRMFHNPAHSMPEVFTLLCEHVWQRLDLTGKYQNCEAYDPQRNDALPVHPKVAEILGLKWSDERTRYSCHSDAELTWEEYTRAYISEFLKRPG